MTTFTSQDLEEVRRHLPKTGDQYRGTDSEEFVVRALYTPNEEPDQWIEYASCRTQIAYSCRLEAFLARFTAVEKNT